MNYQTLYKGYFSFPIKVQAKWKNKYCKTQEVIIEGISRGRNIGKVT